LNNTSQESLKTHKIFYFTALKDIIQYIKEYFHETDKRILASVTVFTAILIFFNYHFHIDDEIRKRLFAIKLISWYIVFLTAFAVPYFICRIISGRKYSNTKKFLCLLFIAPLVFSLKLTLDFPVNFTGNANWDNYWGHIIYWPLLVIITGGMLFILWIIFDKQYQPFYGIKTKGIDWKPYLLMLMIMLPLVAVASTQSDFLEVYPKLKSIAGVYHESGTHWWRRLLFELSYGTDFISIELFFRGFLILAFIKWAGKDAILPMACFYCTIHFGKPLGECISSYFGGMILGIIVYHTRSIVGGLIVHMGIAWMMELGGYIGNSAPFP
jgi:hypothetical protein